MVDHVHVALMVSSELFCSCDQVRLPVSDDQFEDQIEIRPLLRMASTHPLLDQPSNQVYDLSNVFFGTVHRSTTPTCTPHT